MRFTITRTYVIDVNEDQWDFYNDDPITEEGVLLNFLAYWDGREVALTYMECVSQRTSVKTHAGEQADTGSNQGFRLNK